MRLACNKNGHDVEIVGLSTCDNLTGKGSTGKRIFSIESKSIRAWTQKASRSGLKAKAIEAELQSTYITNPNNLPASWISESREIQVQFAREYMQMDENFIQNTPHDIFSSFYAVWKVRNPRFQKYFV